MIKSPETIVRGGTRAVAILCLLVSAFLTVPLASGSGHERADVSAADSGGSQPSPDERPAPHNELSCGICQIAHSPNLPDASVQIAAFASTEIVHPLRDAITPVEVPPESNQARAPPSI